MNYLLIIQNILHSNPIKLEPVQLYVYNFTTSKSSFIFVTNQKSLCIALHIHENGTQNYDFLGCSGGRDGGAGARAFPFRNGAFPGTSIFVT